MKKQGKIILIYEVKAEIHLIFKDYFSKLGYTIKLASNIEQMGFFIEQLTPHLIIINDSELSAVFSPTHNNNNAENIPILLSRPQKDIHLLKNFKKIFFFNKPINENDFKETCLELLAETQVIREYGDAFSGNWLEEKAENGYNFHYTGAINQTDFHMILERIEELIAVGRNYFILNLTEAIHVENITPASFSKLYKIVTNSKCQLKIIMKASKLAEVLSHEGIDIDQYLD